MSEPGGFDQIVKIENTPMPGVPADYFHRPTRAQFHRAAKHTTFARHEISCLIKTGL